MKKQNYLAPALGLALALTLLCSGWQQRHHRRKPGPHAPGLHVHGQGL